MTTCRQRMRVRTSPLQQCVYFIQAAGCDGPVKIGVARDPFARMADLQIGNHEHLLLLGHTPLCDAYVVERQLHARFEKASLRGEWFRITPDLFREIERLCGDECYLNGDARSMIGLLWPYGEDISPEMVHLDQVELLEARH